MANQTISGKTVVAATLNELKAIQVPVDLLNVWGPHLGRAYSNLQVLYKAMDDQEKKENQTQEANSEAAEESPELHIVEGGNEDAEENQLEGTVQE